MPAWPAEDIGRPPGSDHFYSLPWSAFSPTLEEDVRRFLDRPGGDWLDLDTSDRRPLRPRTIKNYEDAYRRAASILVIQGTPGGNIQTLADLVTITAVQTILRFLMERTKRKEGGIVAYMAFALYFAAKEHVGVKPSEQVRLEQIWRRLRGPYGEMSRRTFERLLQFDEPAAMHAMAGFPYELAQMALKRKTVDDRSIKLMRTALFLAIALDTGLRARNLVSIDVTRHLALFQEGKKWKARLSVPGDEVKNGVDIVTELTPLTVQVLRRWLAEFRPAVCAVDCTWLFPASTGDHLSGSHAYQDVKDLALRHLGLDVTPHLIRSFIGKAMLDERPDSHADIQQILGHRQLKTTISFYAPVRPSQARRRYHDSLGQLRGRS